MKALSLKKMMADATTMRDDDVHACSPFPAPRQSKETSTQLPEVGLDGLSRRQRVQQQTPSSLLCVITTTMMQ
jgi:hypothetical protein